jgi:DNA-directed RNA polymerase subunit RPC12/RpoP
MEDQKLIITDTNQKDVVCSNCAGKLIYMPGSEFLLCEFCGAKNIIEIRDEVIEELDFEQFLKESIDTDKDTVEVKTFDCNACGAKTSIDSNTISSECPFCGSKFVVSQESCTRIIKPKSLLPFKVSQKEAIDEFKKWLRKLWFAPPKLKKYARQAEKLNGIYIPFWTYDSDTSTYYTGQRGIDYTETETYTDSKGETQTRSVTRTSWTSVSGTVRLFFDDVLVVASDSLPKKKVDKLEPWDFDNLVPYEEKFLSGFRAENYKTGLKEGFDEAKIKMDPKIRKAINRDIGGDRQQITSMSTTYSNVTFKHMLLPIWISAYRFNNKVYRFLVNARTGKVSGERPWCWWKIALAVLAGLAIIGAIIYFANS